MYRVLNTDNAQNTMTIQGAYSHNSNVDICRILFQNYDADSAKTYDMASIGMQDQWGSSNLNGIGNITFKTNEDGSKILHERMRVQYDGKVGIGTVHPSHELDLVGDLNVSGYILRNNQPLLSNNTLYLDNSYISASNTRIGVFTKKPNEDFEVHGNILSQNVIRKTSSNSISVCWNSTSDICFETQQYVNSNNVKGTRIQKHTLNTNTLQVKSDMTTGTGNIDAYLSLSIHFTPVTSNSLSISSQSTLNVPHTLTVNVSSCSGNVWFT